MILPRQIIPFRLSILIIILVSVILGGYIYLECKKVEAFADDVRSGTTTIRSAHDITLEQGLPYTVLKLQDDASAILVADKNFLSRAPQEARALAALYGYLYGSQCVWDGPYTDDRSNLKCVLTDSLSLGYQCSDKEINLLQTYFPERTDISKENCPTTPEGSTVDNELVGLTLTKLDYATFEASYTVALIDSRNESYTTKTATDTYLFADGHFESNVSDQ